VDPAELVKDAALRLLDDDTSFRAGVRKGIEQADRGEFIEEEEMDARIKRTFQPNKSTLSRGTGPGGVTESPGILRA
jgi:predicted transcriptional regulator